VGLDSVKGSLYVQQEAGGKWQPRQESNLDQTFRKRLFYPLNYGAV
jgi:inorganic pyrophosphatase